MVLGKLDSHMQKNEIGSFSYAVHKNKLKMDKRPKCETGNHQNPKGEHRQSPLWLSHSNFLLDMSLETRETKAKMNSQDLIKIKASAQQRKQSTKFKGNKPGPLGDSVVERLLSVQGVILEFWDRVPHRAPCMEPCFSLRLCLRLSLSVCLSWIHK